MLLKRGKRYFTLVFILCFASVLTGCSWKQGSSWKEVNPTESEQEIEVDWESVNASLHDNGNYITKSIKEAEMIVGYPIRTFKEVPQELEYAGIHISDLGLRLNNPPLTVMQIWSHKHRENSIVLLHLHNSVEYLEYEEQREKLIKEQMEEKELQLETVVHEPWKAVFTSFISATALAFLDEYHQLFVSGRSGSYIDVTIDLIGVIFAIILINFSFWLTKLHNQRHYRYY